MHSIVIVYIYTVGVCKINLKVLKKDSLKENFLFKKLIQNLLIRGKEQHEISLATYSSGGACPNLIMGPHANPLNTTIHIYHALGFATDARGGGGYLFQSLPGPQQKLFVGWRDRCRLIRAHSSTSSFVQIPGLAFISLVLRNWVWTDLVAQKTDPQGQISPINHIA